MIRPLAPDDAGRCDAIVLTLPLWFANDEGIRECAEAVRAQCGLIYVDEGVVIGFLTWKRHHPGSVEITWLAVAAEERGRGVGRALIEALVASSPAERWLTVKTLSVTADYAPYDATRAFYVACGFEPLQELAIWGPDNPATLYVRRL